MLYWLYVLILFLLIATVALLAWKLKQLTDFCNAIADGFSDVLERDIIECE